MISGQVSERANDDSNDRTASRSSDQSNEYTIEEGQVAYTRDAILVCREVLGRTLSKIGAGRGKATVDIMVAS